MARICAVCGKKPQVACFVSHAHNRTRRWVYPNVHRIRFTLANQPEVKVLQDHVCAKCMKAGKVVKVV